MTTSATVISLHSAMLKFIYENKTVDEIRRHNKSFLLYKIIKDIFILQNIEFNFAFCSLQPIRMDYSYIFDVLQKAEKHQTAEQTTKLQK